MSLPSTGRALARLLAVAAVPLLLLVTGCGSGGATALLENQTWSVSELDGRPASPPASTATFQSGRLTGNGGCTGYSATYAVDGSQIRINSIMPTTEARCSPDAEAQQEAYLGALGAVTRFSIRGNELRMSSPTQRDLMVFAAGFTGR